MTGQVHVLAVPRDGVPVLAATAAERERHAAHPSRLPMLDDLHRDAFVADYRQLAATLDAANANDWRYWCATPGNRNAQQSELYLGLECLWQLAQSLPDDGTDSPVELEICIPSPSLATLASALAQQHGLTVTSDHGTTRPPASSGLRMAWNALRYMETICGKSLGAARLPDSNLDLAFISATTEALLKRNSHERDLIFGALPHRLNGTGARVAVIAQVVGDAQAVAAATNAAAAHEMPTVHTLADVAGRMDALTAWMSAATWSPRVPPLLSQLGIAVDALARADIHAGRWRDLPTGALMRRIVKALAQNNPAAVVVHPHENNGWEHACQTAAKQSGLRVVGIQHNALTPGNEKMYAGASRPSPDLTIAAGPGAQQTLSEVFGYDSARLERGYALRQSGLYSVPQRELLQPPLKRPLVLLQGTAESIVLLDLLNDAFAASDDREVTLRPHPAVSLDQQIKKSRLGTLRQPFVVSTEPSLHTDLVRHDVAISCGSTAGWEAVALGVPLVHVYFGTATSESPMFAEPALVKTVTSAAELLLAIDAFESMTQDEYGQQRQRAREHFERCFAPETEASHEHLTRLLRA